MILANRFPDIMNVCTFLISSIRISDINNWNLYFTHLLLSIHNTLIIIWIQFSTTVSFDYILTRSGFGLFKTKNAPGAQMIDLAFDADDDASVTP